LKSILLKVAFEIDDLLIRVEVWEWFGVEPIHHPLFERVGKEVISGRAVMTDEIPLEVIADTEVESLIVLAVHEIHIEHGKLVFP
jgi:hypothetical protein